MRAPRHGTRCPNHETHPTEKDMMAYLTPADVEADLRDHLVVGSMCHCDDRTDDGRPDPDCDDHWELYLVDDAAEAERRAHIGRGRLLTEAHMRAIVEAVRS